MGLCIVPYSREVDNGFSQMRDMHVYIILKSWFGGGREGGGQKFKYR